MRWTKGVDVGRLALWLTVAIGVLVWLGVVNRVSPSPAVDPFDLDRPLSPVALLSGFLLLAAAGVASLLRRASSRGGWGLAAVALAIIGLAGLTAAEGRLQQRLDVDIAVVWLVVALAATAFLAAAAYLLRAQRGPAIVIVAGGLLWLCAQPLESGLGDPTTVETVVRSLFETGAGALLALGLLSYLQDRLAADPELAPGPALGSHEFTLALVLRASPVKIAAGVAVVIALLSAAGAIEGASRFEAYFLNLIGQYTIPATFSAALLLVAGWLALTLGRLSPGGCARPWWWSLAAVLLFLGAVEYAGIHRDLQELGGVGPSQLYVAPIAIAGVTAWAAVLRRLAEWRDAAWLWIGGAGAWAISQVVDLTQPSGRFAWTVVPEEALEAAGSALFGLALVVAIGRVLRESPTTTELGGRQVGLIS